MRVGGGPVVALEPGNVAEARDAMRSGGVVALAGGGTKADWGSPLTPAPEVVVSSSGLDQLVAHNQGDLTAVVGAGMPIARLQEHLACAGQWLALDPASVGLGATVGGLLATGDAGPRRHRYGAMRDLAIGLTAVLADGTVAHSGGQVIKNVAGYDLAKVFCGSLGTLGLVTGVSLRLHPLPAASATVRVASSALVATGFVLALLASPVVAAALDWAGEATWVRIEGTPAGVKAQVSGVAHVAASLGLSSEVVEGAEESAAWAELALGSYGAPGEVVARAATLPSQLGDAAEALGRAAGAAEVEAVLTSHAGVGLHTARLPASAAESLASAVRGWRAAVGVLGGTVVVRRTVPGLAELVDAWGPPPRGARVMRRVKEALDPEGRLAPGRFSPWF
ncbi:MAG: FAD-binding oxidoreductase [Acidimicrobiales bacterium]